MKDACREIRLRFDETDPLRGAHLESCEDCVREYETWKQLNRLLDEMPPVPAPDDLLEAVLAALPRPRPKALPFDRLEAASVVLGLGFTLVAILLRGTELPSLESLFSQVPLSSLSQVLAWAAVGGAIAYALGNETRTLISVTGSYEGQVLRRKAK
ncbi:MAG TPA: hypothetical protein DD435_10340 [Cyanobacteria bacterium UBA8530]|nr:hypothetical protein [Cyanobacteria bacterium UBA8530]